MQNKYVKTPLFYNIFNYVNKEKLITKIFQFLLFLSGKWIRDIPTEAFNTYCWIHSTYFVTGAMLGVAGVNVAFPGVGPSVYLYNKPRQDDHQLNNRRGDGPLKQVKYYQWVAFTLIFQVNYYLFVLTCLMKGNGFNRWDYWWMNGNWSRFVNIFQKLLKIFKFT